MTRMRDLHKTWLRDPEYLREYRALEEQYALAYAMIEARARAGLTQEQLAERMKTSQRAIARMESGRTIHPARRSSALPAPRAPASESGSSPTRRATVPETALSPAL